MNAELCTARLASARRLCLKDDYLPVAVLAVEVVDGIEKVKILLCTEVTDDAARAYVREAHEIMERKTETE